MSRQTSRPTVETFLFNGQSLDSPCKIVNIGETDTKYDFAFEGTVEEASKSKYADHEVLAWEARYNGIKVVIYIYVRIK